jgi:Tfp pilus assembly protein PilF
MSFHKDFSGLLSRYETLFLLLLALLAILIYANTMSSPFVFDSRNNIETNPHIRISKITPDSLANAALKSPSRQRPLPNISFALNYFIHGYNVVGFHVVNILIHISTGFLLYFFIKTTFRTPVLRSRYSNTMWIAFFTAAIWMFHPLQTQSVSYIVQRMNSLASMFYVLSILLYARFRLNGQSRKKWWRLSGCIMAGILALASKQTAATLPVFIIAYEWFFFQDLNLKRLKNYIPLLAGCLLLTAFIALILLGGDPLDKILGSYKGRDFTPIQRLLTQPRVVIFYISLLFWPHPSRLNLDHDFLLSHSMLDPITTLFSILALTAGIGLAVITARKQRLVSFCILWFFGNLVIESSIIALEIIFEHRVYLPSMMFCLIVVLFVYRWVKPTWLQAVLLCGMITVGAVWTYERNTVYSNRITLWQDCVNKSPGKARPYNNLGVALADYGYHDEAIKNYLRALQINPSYQDAIANIGLSLAEQGKIEESIIQFLKALEINPKDYKTLNNLAASLIVQERHAEAVEYLSKAIRLNPYNAKAHNNLGVALQLQGRSEEAIDHFSFAVKLDPEFTRAYNNLGLILSDQGRFEEAIVQFSTALKINPGYKAARKNYEETQRNLKGNGAAHSAE